MNALRRRLANRRGALSWDFEHQHLRYRAHVAFFDDGKCAELFLDSAKPDSAVDALDTDAAILISLLLQRGAPLSEIAHALRRNPSGLPASLIGEAIHQLAAVEAGHG
jgi:hypothetical protein